jgi:hypothetical protein
VVPVVVEEISAPLAAHLPTGAISSLVTARIGGTMVDPLPALALLGGYLVLAGAGAIWILKRRDA